MLNLLRFRPRRGERGYRAYLESNAVVWARYASRCTPGGGGAALAAEAGQAWNAVAVVRYPSQQAFHDVIRDREYQADEHHRTDALIESVLQPTTPLVV